MNETMQPASATRLADNPDWRYLLHEFHEHYRHLSSGGSAAIRTHQRAVRAGIAATMRDNPPLGGPAPFDLPVTRHLRRALDEGKLERSPGFIRAIEAVAGQLTWQYGYEKVPKGLATRYGFAEFAGPNGPILTDRVILGIVLFAPRCIYPAHAHEGITESYVCLSGAMSENNQGVFAPGSLIFNPPGHTHRITVSEYEPCLLAYAWHGAAPALAGQKMVFSRPRRPAS